MNYAILGPKGRINRLTEIEPNLLPENASIVQITDDQKNIVEAGRNTTPPTFYFYIDGQLVTQQDAQEQRRAERLAARPRPTISAERHIEREGFPAIRLVTLMDLEGKMVAAGEISAKLVAVRAWLDSILGTFASNPQPRNDWPEAPFGFEETVQDAASKLN
jgi:hypothetical protein